MEKPERFKRDSMGHARRGGEGFRLRFLFLLSPRFDLLWDTSARVCSLAGLCSLIEDPSALFFGFVSYSVLADLISFACACFIQDVRWSVRTEIFKGVH